MTVSSAHRPAQQQRSREPSAAAEQQREAERRGKRAGDQDQRIDDAVLEQRPGRRRLQHRQGAARCPSDDANQASKAPTLPAKGGRLQLGVERRQHAGGVGAAGLGVAVGALPDGLLLLEEARCRCGWRGAMSRNTPSRWKIWLIRSSARPSRSLPSRATAMPQGTCAKPNFASKRPAKARIGEVVTRRSCRPAPPGCRSGPQPLRQADRLVEQHQPGAVRRPARRSSRCRPCRRRCVRECPSNRRRRASRGPTTVVSDW